MEFEAGINALAKKMRSQQDIIQTEEATKNAFIMPFISQVLGYDVFNPLEVMPEFTADHGTKKGEKVDYAIMQDGEVRILIECKKIGSDLNVKHASQLFRYFSVTNSRIAILTNGQVFHFFTDLDSPNIMDKRPFLVLDLLDIDETILPELKKITKDTFDLDSIISSAEELKYVGALKREVASIFKELPADFVKMLMTSVSDKRATADNIALFRDLVDKALKQFLKEQVNDRLKTALGDSDLSIPEAITIESAPAAVDTEDNNQQDDNGVVTTEEELAGYQIVKAIACSEVKPQRIAHRDAKSYFAILLDDNNRKPIARLHFNAKSQWYVGTFDADKKETRHPINDLEDIYTFADIIRATVRSLEA